MPAVGYDQSYSLLEVIRILSFRLGDYKAEVETIDDPDISTLALIDMVDEVCRDIWRAKFLPWYQRDMLIPLAPSVTGDFSISSLTPSTLTSSSLFISEHAGGLFAFTEAGCNGRYVTHRIKSYTSASEVSLHTPWGFASNTSKEGIVYPDTYALPDDFAGLVGAYLCGSNANRTLQFKTPEEMDTIAHRSNDNPVDTGYPRYCCVTRSLPVSPLDDNATGTVTDQNSWSWSIRVYPALPASTVNSSLLVRYKALPDMPSTGAQIVPVLNSHIDVLVDGVLALWKERRGGEGASGLYQQWMEGPLAEYVADMSFFSDERVLGEEPVTPMDSQRIVTL